MRCSTTKLPETRRRTTECSGSTSATGRWERASGRCLPTPAQVAVYLAERMEEYGHKPATLRVAASAIAFVHKTAGVEDPCASPAVQRTLRSATRKAGKSQKQAAALTTEALAAIQSTACIPTARDGAAETRVRKPPTIGEIWTWRSSASCGTPCCGYPRRPA